MDFDGFMRLVKLTSDDPEYFSAGTDMKRRLAFPRPAGLRRAARPARSGRLPAQAAELRDVRHGLQQTAHPRARRRHPQLRSGDVPADADRQLREACTCDLRRDGPRKLAARRLQLRALQAAPRRRQVHRAHRHAHRRLGPAAPRLRRQTPLPRLLHHADHRRQVRPPAALQGTPRSPRKSASWAASRRCSSCATRSPGRNTSRPT